MAPKPGWSHFKEAILNLRNASAGQDLVEYALLTGFMVIAVWAIFPTSIFPSASAIFSKLLSTAVVLTGS